MHSTIYKIDKQRPTLQHNGTICNNLKWKRTLKRTYIWIHIYVTESICCTHEMNTTL